MESIPTGLRLGLAAVCYASAYLVGVAVFVWAMRRRGFAARAIAGTASAAILGGIVGGEFVQLAVAGEPGRTILGGVAAGWLAVIAAKRVLGITRPLGDAFAFAIAGGEAVGRIGCFVWGCCYGKEAHVPWAVVDHGAARHPTQLYSAAAALATLAVLVWLDRRLRLPDNTLFYVQGTLLCASRFAIEFVREGPAAGPLTLAQYACLAGIAFFVWRLRQLFVTERVVFA
jgi:phosphatidylglycerol:prolipoprotein diacylglycerol transferase